MYDQEESMDFSNAIMIMKRCEELANSHEKMLDMRGPNDGLVEFIEKTLHLNMQILDAIKSRSVSH